MAIFRGAPDESGQDKIARQMGLQIVRPPPQPIEVWPDHWQPVEVFEAMVTQWTIAPSGRRVGLRYETMLGPGGVMDTLGVAPDDRREVFDYVRTMEAELLSHLADLEQRDKPRATH